MLFGLIKRMGVEPEIRGSLKERSICLEVKGGREGILIGKSGRTVEALEIFINLMVNGRVKDPIRVVVDIDHYRERSADSIEKLADRLGEKAKKEGKTITIAPFNAQDRRIIHLALRDDKTRWLRRRV